MFPLVVQNSVPVRQIGSAVSNLSFFQQIGGTVGLAITGTVFATSLTREIPSALASAGVPPQVGGALAAGGGAAQNLTGVGDMGAAILASLPAEAQAAVEPFIPAIVGAIHQAFSIATASHVRHRDRDQPRSGRPRAAVPRGTRNGGGRRAGRSRAGRRR